jgi:hypothetical protein
MGNSLFIDDAVRGDKGALIVVLDVAGLNNGNHSSLAKHNLKHLKTIFTKRNIKRSRINSVDFITFDEVIEHQASIKSRKSTKVYRKAVKEIDRLETKLYENKEDKAKDVVSMFRYLTMFASQKLSNYTKISVVIYSNLRQSTNIDELKTMNPIVMDSKMKIQIFAKSGLEAKGATTSQVLSSEQQIVDFYSSKINGNVTISTIY